jgi:hypothetical protein
MLADAPNFNTTNGFDYTITPTPQGWQLTVWEEAEVTDKRIYPFLWKFRVELPTLNQAHFILQSILGDEQN